MACTEVPPVFLAELGGSGSMMPACAPLVAPLEELKLGQGDPGLRTRSSTCGAIARYQVTYRPHNKIALNRATHREGITKNEERTGRSPV